MGAAVPVWGQGGEAVSPNQGVEVGGERSPSINDEGDYVEDENPALEQEADELDSEPVQSDAVFTEETNPLNPLGDGTFEQLLRLQMNDDAWSAMMDPLPCLDASEVCVRELQELAVQNSFVLQEIDQRIELVNERIEAARASNQRTIRLGVFEPFVQELIRMETVSRVPDPNNQPAPGSIVRTEQRGFLDRVGDYFRNPTNAVNTVLSLIGVPLFHVAGGGDAATQTREIGIADLQVKVAEVERQRGEMANTLREEVLKSVLEFETTKREFQAWQEMGRRSQLRNEVLELNYRYVADSMTTPQYLAEQNNLDGNYLQMFRAWAQLRTKLTRIKIVVLGAEGI